MSIGDWAQIASGTGALAAVVVALFGPQLRGLLAPPRLDLKLQNPAGVEAGDWCQDSGGEEGVPARWYHLRASNPHRWSPVTAVRVFVVEIEDLGADPHPLWVGEVPVPWRYPKQAGELVDLGRSRDCDLCMIGLDNVLWLQQASPRGIPKEILSHESSVHLKLTLQASGMQAESRPRTVRLDREGVGPLRVSCAKRSPLAPARRSPAGAGE